MTARKFSSVPSLVPGSRDDAEGDALPPASPSAPTYDCQTTHDAETGITEVGAGEGIYTRHPQGVWLFAPWENLDATMPVVTIETLYWLEMEHMGAAHMAQALVEARRKGLVGDAPRHLRVVL